MLKQENLETERLKLKKLTKQYLNDYIEWRSQEEYYNFIPNNPKTKKEIKQKFKSLIREYKNKKDPFLMWGIYLKETNKLIGSVTIEDWSVSNKYCELSWGLNPRYQNKGYAFESTKCVIDYIFNNLNMNRISAYVWEGNIASKKLAEKLGFTHEGTDRKARFKNNKFLDVYCFGLLKDEWKNIQ